MALISSWLLLGFFIGSALMLTSALYLIYRAPALMVRAAERAGTGRSLAAVATANTELSKQLFQAGFQHPKAARWFVYAKLGCAFLAVLAGVLLVRLVPYFQEMSQVAQLCVLMILAAVGYFIPVTVVDRRRADWLRRIELGLPDALDFMLICVEAGHSTDLAVMRVASELAPVHPELSAGFVSLTEALTAGADRHEAWLKLAQETDNDDLRQLASIIMQSTTMGTPVAHTLRVFSADLRDQRVRKVEERANVLPTKMTLGTMIFTVPPLLILLLAPAIYRILSTF